MGIAAAVAGAAVVGAGATMVAGSKAAKAQKSAAKQASATELQMFEQTRADQAPYREVGQGALYKLADMYGVSRPSGETQQQQPGFTGSGVRSPFIGAGMDFVGMQQPGAQAGTVQQSMTPGYEDWQQSPGYDFRRDEALKAVQRMGSARGARFSPQTWKAGARYADNLASAEFENYANALRSMAGIGQTSVGQTGALGSQVASNVGQNIISAGNARASSYANTGAAISGLGQNLAYGYLSGQFGGAAPVGAPPVTGYPTVPNYGYA